MYSSDSVSHVQVADVQLVYDNLIIDNPGSIVEMLRPEGYKKASYRW